MSTALLNPQVPKFSVSALTHIKIHSGSHKGAFTHTNTWKIEEKY